jgi:hypothetical protein
MLRCLVLFLAAVGLGGCEHTLGNDEGVKYIQRKDTVTFSAGDAKQVNAVAHMITPWPRGVYDPRIPVDASRLVERAIVPYRSAAPAETPPVGVPTLNGNNGAPPNNGSTAR